MFLLKSLYHTVIISNTLDYNLFQHLLFMLCAATCTRDVPFFADTCTRSVPIFYISSYENGVPKTINRWLNWNLGRIFSCLVLEIFAKINWE